MFKALEGIISRARACLRKGRGLGSPQEYQHEIQRLQHELETVRAKREKEKAEFLDRHTILDTVPRHGGMSLEDVDQRLQNLRRIRDGRLEAEERAYERQIRALEQQLQERFGHP
jgi:hypothetical protein